MKYLLIFIIVFNSLLFAVDSEANKSKNKILQKQLKEAMEQEKKFAREQTFYKADSYDFKGSEVNEESLKHIEVIEMEDFDMDSVYD